MLELIVLTRLEGPISECDKPLEFTTFDEANEQIKKWASATHGEGYDKVKFEVMFVDETGEEHEYNGRYDMYADMERNKPLQKGVYNYLTWLQNATDAYHSNYYKGHKDIVDFFASLFKEYL
jgi:Large polyvalent protein associated domain 25